MKRRQQEPKPRGSPDIFITLKRSLSLERGQHRQDRHGRGIVGSAGVADRGKGTGWIAWEPLMSQVKHKAHGYPVPHADWREIGAPMDRAEERAGPEDVGEQALMRGLDTAFPFLVWGCPGLRSGVDQMIGHTGSLWNSPAVVPPSLLHD